VLLKFVFTGIIGAGRLFLLAKTSEGRKKEAISAATTGQSNRVFIIVQQLVLSGDAATQISCSGRIGGLPEPLKNLESDCLNAF